ncbi:TniQ family protein [Paraglaciecola hydrolytica]|uniref:TniQ domain-containing protein n=1 Tax=Paraglaciecola hydrolytica TaxID=1799789 RepID=A0A136A2Z8_9ALTE|nr:TniQ family protein [Paraglaciecola hydrolytica]KXI29602.1 hypothetical protein AX660_05985 [Paraglaciecola hydrolytica]
MNLLPQRPFIKNGENVLGYLLRLAKKNRFNSLSELIKSYSTKKVPTTYRKNSVDGVVELASKLVGRSINLEKNYLLGEYEEDPSVSAGKRFSLSRKPCICTECVKEDGVIYANWQYTPNSYCTKHKMAHINVCQTCSRELQWNTDLLDLVCQHCGSKLCGKTIDTEPHHIRKLRTLQGQKKWVYTSKLFDYAVALIRPFDLIDKRVTESPIMLRNWNELYSMASQMIELGENVPSAYSLFNQLFYEYPFDDFAQSPLAAGMKQVLKRHPTNDECRLFVDAAALKKWLGLSEFQVQSCIELKFTKVTFKKPYCGTFIYDFSDWQRLLQRVRTLDEVGTPIQQVAEEAPIFWNYPEEIVIGVLRSRIPVRFKNPNMPNFSEAFVDRKTAHYYLRKQRGMKFDQVLSQYNASKLLGVGPQIIRKFIKDGKLSVMVPNNKVPMICIDSLNKLIDNESFPTRDKVLNAYPSFISN